MEPITETRVSKQMQKVKIKKDVVLMEWTETTSIVQKNPDTNEVVSENKFTSKRMSEDKFLPHADFSNAMKMLRKPVIDITESGNFKDFEKYTVKGISLSGMEADDTARVVISASKKLENNNRPFNFVTPPVTLFDNNEYADAEKLDKFCKVICDEAWLYLGGKHAESPQLSLEFQDGEKKIMEVQP